MSVKKSVAEKEFEGTLKPSRSKVDKTALLQRFIKPPIPLNDNAARIYKDVLQLLIKNEVATILDTYAIAMFAIWLDIFIDTYQNAPVDKISKNKWVQQFKSGATNVTGWASLLKTADGIVQMYMKKLGLSIKDRELISAFAENKSETEEDPFDIMLQQIVNSELE